VQIGHADLAGLCKTDNSYFLVAFLLCEDVRSIACCPRVFRAKADSYADTVFFENASSAFSMELIAADRAISFMKDFITG